jgi:predicted Zn-dependent protease
MVGLLFALVVHLLKIEETIIAPAIEKETTLTQHPGLERASEARLAGDLATARREITGVLREEPDNLDAWLESWEIALDAEDGAAAGRAGGRLLELLRRRGERELLWDLMNDPRWRALPMPARFLQGAADHHLRQGDGRSALDLLQRLSANGAPDDVAVLRALVGEGEILARAGDTRAAEKVFERARAHPACSEPWVERMDEALRRPSRPDPSPRRG